MEHLSGSSVAAAALSSAGGSGSGSGSGAPVVLSDSLSAALAPDVEYHLREVVQDAAKFMRRAKRDTLRAEDVNAALRARRCPELLGYAGSGGSVEPVVCSVGDEDMGDGDVGGRAGTAAAGGEAAVRSVHLLRDRVLDFGELLRAPLPKCPVAPSFTAHWLAVDGAQPRVPQNPQPGSSAADGSSSSSSSSSAAADTSFSASAKRKRGEQGGEHGAVAGNEQGDGADGGGGGGVLTKRLVKHVLSRELQAYFSLVEQAVRRGGEGAGGHGAGGRRGGGAGAEAAEAAEAEEAEEEQARGVFRSLRRDPALQELAPYLCRFFFAEVARSARARALGALRPLLRLAECLLQNPHLRVELYLDQVLTTY
jgi:transcription initiation factor TFIID subunit 6